MGISYSPRFTLLLTLFFLPLGMPFTVIVSDSSFPSALVDAPQIGYSMNNNGARTNKHEQEAVYEIMKATGNEWATDIPDICRGRWHGIECIPDEDNVYHIVSLSFGALSDDTAFPICDPNRSFMSPSITKLPHLRNLFFYRCLNYNPQPIPPFLGKLGSTLQTLVLRDNGHVGPIPDELGNLTHLRVLDLHRNNLNGSIPVSFGRITRLRSVDLSANELTGSIPNAIFSGLSILDLNRNHLSGSIPTTIGTCHSLLKLDLSHNRLSGPVPDSINRLDNLVLLDISQNSLSGPLPVSLQGMKSLQALILNGNPMYSTIPGNIFDGLKDLMILVLSKMNLHGPIPESLGHLTGLRVLHLDGNHLNGSVPSSFQNLSSLGELRLNNNMLTGRVPVGRDMAWRMKKNLRLYNNSGLCFDERNGSADDLDLLYDLDIGHCGAQDWRTGRTVQHLSGNTGNMFRSVGSSSAARAHKSSIYTTICCTLVQLVIIFVYNVR